MSALVLVCPAQRIGPSRNTDLITVTKNASGQIESITTQEETFNSDHLPIPEDVEFAKTKNYTIIMIEPVNIPLQRHSTETKERIEELKSMGVMVLPDFSNLEEVLTPFTKVKFVYYPTQGGPVQGGPVQGGPQDETEERKSFSVFSALFNMNLNYSERYHFYSPSLKLTKIISSKSAIPYFNPFQPINLSDDVMVDDISEYYHHYIVLLEALSAYLRSGFLEGRYNHHSEHLNWELNLAVPELCMFIKYFDLYPNIPDQREMYREQFLCNAQYRQIVTETLAKLMANIIKLNGLSKKNKNWILPEVYETVAEKLKVAVA